VEVNISYDVSIPEKAEEIQGIIAEDVAKLTGLHVSSVHVIFKNVVSPCQMKKFSDIVGNAPQTQVLSQITDSKTCQDQQVSD
jgi:uncharacterized alkaline shock family protein YloU